MLSDLFSTLLKYFLYLLGALVIWLLYFYVVKPVGWRWHYSKYKNVWVSPRFIFFFGDSWDNIKNIMAGKVFYDHHRHISQEVSRYDFKLEMIGPNPFVKVISYKAQAGLEALATEKIDRGREYIGIGKVIGNSFGMSRSNYKAMHRRKLILNMLSFNAASKYIPTM